MLLSKRCLASACLFAAWISFGIEPVQAGLTAGASKKSIVPPFPTQMGGFFDRSKDFEGVHDDLFVRAVVLDNGTTRLAFVGSDLMSVDAELVRLAREQIAREIGIAGSNVLICATHNHSAPSYYQKTQIGQDDAEPSLKRFLAQRFAEAVIEADRAKVPARAGFGAGNLIGATRNRQQKNDLIDPQVGVLRVEERDTRKTIATLFNFTGHPVIVGSTVESLLGGVAIFTQGACGDITVNRSGDPFLEIERLGRTVAGEVIKTSGLITLDDNPVLKSAATTVTLPARSIPTLDEAQKEFDAGKKTLEDAKGQNSPASLIALLEDKNRVLSMAVVRATSSNDNPTKRETELTAEVQVLQVGNVLFGAIPGELFVEYALELRSRVKQQAEKSFCLVGYANGYLGYIVTPRAMETGGYEASITRLNVDAGRTLTETSMNCVYQLLAN